MTPFDDPHSVARYAEGPPRLVPGFADMQRMALLLLAEHAPDDARILVLGAGGGLELRTFAAARPGWSFDGVDPSEEMLKLAAATLGPLAPRARLYRGLIDVAPEGPFDGATCLLTLHFLPEAERLATLEAVRCRLKPGAPFVVVHHSIAGDEDDRARWLSRYAAFAVASGVPPEQAESARIAIPARLPILAPEEDAALLRRAGFAAVELFYAAFTFRGWVARA
ncbi:class I SAM-dependent methyltransferase [Ancylobacter defluvii]|uniref:Methyltransferase n=1 Tax=Ancylobacter defluvii TaxID=1282440 RepID=A0A9W6N986_9HYPH|nr:class I SAM-dependent methyltransferase [Ancylobacter defluvii]MBS7587522.1 methyltransferase domain-containing protein [Ancylobacter defluvii]GLK82212.1 methyltransferase [Ancylobacter defluvii]